MRSVLHLVLTASIILVYGGGAVFAVEVEHSHGHVHSSETVENHGHHHHDPVDSSTEDQDKKDDNDTEDSHSTSHSHAVSMDAGAFMIESEPTCPRFERRGSDYYVPFEEGCPDGPCFSLMKPPQ